MTEDAETLKQLRDELKKLFEEQLTDTEEEQLEDAEGDNEFGSTVFVLDELPPERVLETMANILLRGYGYSMSDRQRKYLSKDAEGPFRKALVMLLRGNAPLNRVIREALADNIALDEVAPWHRKIEFGFRQEGNQPDPEFSSAVVYVVERHLRDGRTVTAGVKAAAKKFRLSEGQVRRYWGSYAKAMEEAFGFRITKPGRPRKYHE